MKKSAAMFGLVMLSVTSVFAELPVSTGTPSLAFKSIQIDNLSEKLEHRVTPYRLFDKMVVTVYDPVVCGQKPTSPAFKLSENRLSLSYAFAPAATNAKVQCALVSEFVISNVPHGDFAVSFAGGPEPYVVVKLRKCPSYQPKTDDIYECLASEK